MTSTCQLKQRKAVNHVIKQLQKMVGRDDSSIVEVNPQVKSSGGHRIEVQSKIIPEKHLFFKLIRVAM